MRDGPEYRRGIACTQRIACPIFRVCLTDPMATNAIVTEPREQVRTRLERAITRRPAFPEPHGEEVKNIGLNLYSPRCAL